MARRLAVSLLASAVSLACAESVVIRPAGELGGDCLSGDRCYEDLECYRGICVPPGEMMEGDDAGIRPPPPPGVDSGTPVQDAGSPTPGEDGSVPPPPPGEGERVLADRAGQLVDVFVTARGIIVVDAERVRLLDRAGAELATFETGREITAAAFDGVRLGVADRAFLFTLDADLVELARVALAEWCRSAVIVSGSRFVCGPDDDWDRVFRTYDLSSGTELAASDEYTYNGIPMFRVPGTDHFVTVTTGSSPSDFHLYEVAPTHDATFIGESPYHGDFPVTDVFAFRGDPATHLITHEGLMLEIFHPDCVAGMSSFTSGCFTRDGDLGSLRVGESYVAMTQDDAGYVYGLREDGDPWFSDPRCESSCTLHRVDVEARSIDRERTYDHAFFDLVRMRHDAVGGGVVLGVMDEGDRFDGYTGYQVRLVTL